MLLNKKNNIVYFFLAVIYLVLSNLAIVFCGKENNGNYITLLAFSSVFIGLICFTYVLNFLRIKKESKLRLITYLLLLSFLIIEIIKYLFLNTQLYIYKNNLFLFLFVNILSSILFVFIFLLDKYCNKNNIYDSLEKRLADTKPIIKNCDSDNINFLYSQMGLHAIIFIINCLIIVQLLSVWFSRPKNHILNIVLSFVFVTLCILILIYILIKMKRNELYYEVSKKYFMPEYILNIALISIPIIIISDYFKEFLLIPNDYIIYIIGISLYLAIGVIYGMMFYYLSKLVESIKVNIKNNQDNKK